MSRMHQLIRAGAQSGSIMLAGDVMCQFATSNTIQGGSRGIDYRRACQMGLVGCTLHGPYFYVMFGAVDRYFGQSRSLTTVLSKTALIQLTVFPLYLGALFTYLGLLERKAWPEEVLANTKAKVPPSFLAGCVFWPVANAIGFRYFASTSRVAYLASTGVLWNTFISYTNASPMYNKHQ